MSHDLTCLPSSGHHVSTWILQASTCHDAIGCHWHGDDGDSLFYLGDYKPHLDPEKVDWEKKTYDWFEALVFPKKWRDELFGVPILIVYYMNIHSKLLLKLCWAHWVSGPNIFVVCSDPHISAKSRHRESHFQGVAKKNWTTILLRIQFSGCLLLTIIGRAVILH